MIRMCQLPDSTGLLLALKILIRYVPVAHTPDSTVPPLKSWTNRHNPCWYWCVGEKGGLSSCLGEQRVKMTHALRGLVVAGSH